MTIIVESSGTVTLCDGCGRTSTSQGLVLKEYILDDPNIGSGATFHYCGGCALNRGLITQ